MFISLEICLKSTFQCPVYIQLMANKAVKSLWLSFLHSRLATAGPEPGLVLLLPSAPAPAPSVRSNSASVIKKGFNFLCPEDLFVGAFKPSSPAPAPPSWPQICLTPSPDSVQNYKQYKFPNRYKNFMKVQFSRFLLWKKRVKLIKASTIQG